MASLGGKGSNETKVITAGMKQLSGKLADLKSSVASIDKLQAQISKSPDECKKEMEQLEEAIAELSKLAKGFEGVIKNASKAAVK